MRWKLGSQQVPTPVVTVGAGRKEHDHHLPLDTDLRQVMWLGQAIACRWPVLVLPPISYGHYPAFTQYPGSDSVAAQTFIETLEDVVMSIRAHTDTPILIINTGISTIAPIEQVADDLKVTALHVHRGAHLVRTREQHCTQNHGGHGDEGETALMCFIASDSVDISRAEANDQQLPRGNLSHDRTAPTYTPQGVWVRPDLGSATTGRALATAMLANIETTWDAMHANH